MNDEPLYQQQPAEPPAKRRWLTTMPTSAVITLAAVLVATGSATAWWTWQTLSVRKATIAPPDAEMVLPSTDDGGTSGAEQVPTTAQSPLPTAPDAETPSTTEMRSVSIYWVKDTGTHLQVVPSTISLAADQSPEALLKASFEYLLEGPATPSSEEVASTIPSETRINSLTVQADGIHVDLNQAFTTGGGSASMIGRLGQVVYTATTLDPEANVWISIDGDPLEILGGEGVMVAQPMTRNLFDRDFSM